MEIYLGRFGKWLSRYLLTVESRVRVPYRLLPRMGKNLISKNLSDKVFFTKSAPSQTLNYERAYMTRGEEQLEAQLAHNQTYVGSCPTPATTASNYCLKAYTLC